MSAPLLLAQPPRPHPWGLTGSSHGGIPSTLAQASGRRRSGIQKPRDSRRSRAGRLTNGTATGTLEEVGFLDSQPGIDNTDFSGAWSVYPFFQSGIVIGTDTNQGLFVLRPTVIFVGGFESGDTSAWSSTTGRS